MLPRHRRLFAAIVSLIAVTLPRNLAAQEEEADVVPLLPPAPRFDVAPTLVALTQAARDARDEARFVGATAWTVLALAANGSTMRSGPYKEVIREQVAWLKARQDEEGRFTAKGAPCSRTEQFVATVAIAEVCWWSSYTLIKPMVVRGTTAIETAMFGQGAAAPTPEEYVFAIQLAHLASGASIDPTGVTHRILDHARSAMVAGKTRRTDAALHLDALLQGKQHPLELTVARAWPANLTADPLHTLVGAQAVFATSPKTSTSQFDTLDALSAAREARGEYAGTWPAGGGFDRIATTAMHALTLALANRAFERALFEQSWLEYQ